MAEAHPFSPGSRHCSYYGVHDGDLVKPGEPEADVHPLATLVHGQLRAMVLSNVYTCLGAATAVRREHYRLGLYPALGSAEAVEGHAADLIRFAEEHPGSDHPIAVFISVFDGPVRADEIAFETDLWTHLAALDEINPSPTDEFPTESTLTDPGFVFAGRNFFVVGLHPGASRWARRFAWPTLVFNALSHGDPLREAGQFDRMAARIRDRDCRLQGSVNPSIENSRLSQFSGRSVTGEWVCPVTTRQVP